MHKTHDPTRPSVRDVAPYVDAIYDSPDGGAGCCLHIAIDDGNLDDLSIQFCVNFALERGHPVCEKAARLLLRMSGTQRRKARHGTGASPHESVPVEHYCVHPSAPDVGAYVMRGDVLTYLQPVSDASCPPGERRPFP